MFCFFVGEGLCGGMQEIVHVAMHNQSSMPKTTFILMPQS
jgi:hypothetical protein